MDFFNDYFVRQERFWHYFQIDLIQREEMLFFIAVGITDVETFQRAAAGEQ